MKILVTGVKGYIAQSFEKHAGQEGSIELVKLITVRGEKWKETSFSGYDVVLHTAGLVHVRETRSNQYDYYEINRDLAYDVAQKAKNDGVRQFIFLSSMSVYGFNRLPEGEFVDADTPAKPVSNYGRSKLAAEELISELRDATFKVAILRPPMVYGAGCPGNFRRLCGLIKMAKFFPDYENARSMVYIQNLCVHITHIILEGSDGLFFPRDASPICTSKMATWIAEVHGKPLKLTKMSNNAIDALEPRVGMLSKLFGSLVIDPALPTGGGENLTDVETAIRDSVM